MISNSRPTVSVTIVTYNSAAHIERCLATLVSQIYPPHEIIIADNASSDGTPVVLARLPHIRLIRNSSNLGFSAGQNQAIAASTSDWILCLNPDTVLRPDFILRLVESGESNAAVGIVCPKILRMHPDGTPTAPPVLDSAGGYFTPWLRHHDRGSQQIDLGQYDTPEYVFGYTGAAALFRRKMIEAISIDGEFMDEDFFCFREDADLSWRAQLLGWKCLYSPSAVAYHVRRVFDDNRRELPAFINLHSTKNRFLMRIKNMTPGVYARVFLPATARDLGIVAYALLREQTSLPGFWMIAKLFGRMWRKRQSIQSRRVTADSDLAMWFKFTPTSRPVETDLATALGSDQQSQGMFQAQRSSTA